MRLKRLIAFIIPSLAFIVAISLLIGTLSGESKTKISSDQWKSQLLRCMDEDKYPDKNVRGDCAGQLLLSATKQGDLGNVINILAKIADHREAHGNWMTCHRAVHKVGSEIVQILGGVDAAFDTLATSVCGFIHVPYDSFGRESHSFDEWVLQVRKCESIVNNYTNSSLAPQCDDGVGHALQQSLMHDLISQRDKTFAQKVCSSFMTQGRRLGCHEALVMELYGPLDPFVKAHPAPQADSLMAECLSIAYEIIDAREGCSSGVGWLLGTKSTVAINKAMMAETEEERLYYFDIHANEVIRVCDVGGIELSSYCFQRHSSLLRDEMANSPQYVGEYCSSPSIKKYLRSCLFGARELMGDSSRAEIMRLFPDIVPDFNDHMQLYPAAPVPDLVVIK